MKQFLQDSLINKIPITTAMAISVDEASAQYVSLKAPLEGNTNHQGTGFGGSIYSLAVLAGWGLLTAWLKEQELDASVVIKTATMDYLRPVEGDLYAACGIPDGWDEDRLMRMLEKRGRAKVNLMATVTTDAGEAAALSGDYVVIRSASSSK